MKRSYAVLMALLCLYSLTVFSQVPNKIEPLKIGDMMPDTEISNLRNYPKNKVRISDFKGKLLILDFWATWCSSCYESFPGFDQLQKEFGDKIQFILVNAKETKETEEKVANLFATVKANTGYVPKLPYVIQEPVLGQLFPFKSLPHYAWIDGEGKVRAITYKGEVTRENIHHVLRGGFLHTKQDIPGFDRIKPLPIDLFDRKEVQRKYRSIITGYIEGIAGYNSFAPDGLVYERRVYRFNMDLKLLMNLDDVFDELSVSKPDKKTRTVLPNSQVIFNTTDPEFRNSFLNLDVYNRDYLYTYELILPDTLSFKIVKQFIRDDFSRYFNFKIKREDRKTSVYVLKSTRKLASIKSTFDVVNQAVATKYYKTTHVASMERNAMKKYVKNGTIAHLLNWLNTFSAIPILTDEVITHQSQRYDFDFPTDIYDYSPAKLKALLQGLGFEVVEEERVLPFAIFTDRY